MKTLTSEQAINRKCKELCTHMHTQICCSASVVATALSFKPLYCTPPTTITTLLHGYTLAQANKLHFPNMCLATAPDRTHMRSVWAQPTPDAKDLPSLSAVYLALYEPAETPPKAHSTIGPLYNWLAGCNHAGGQIHHLWPL